MPRIPTYDTFQVAPEALPAFRQQPIPAGEGLQKAGSAVQALGGELIEFAQKKEEEKNARLLMEAENDLVNNISVFHTDVLSRRGEAVTGVLEQSRDWYDKQTQDISNRFRDNRKVKDAFLMVASKRKASFYDPIRKHWVTEESKAFVDAATNSISGNIRALSEAASRGDLSGYDTAVERMKSTFDAMASNRAVGMPQAVKEETWAKLKSQMHTEVAYALGQAPGGSALAIGYIEKYSKEIDTKAELTLREHFKRTGNLEIAQKTVDSIMADPKTTLDSGLAEIKKRHTGEARHAAEAEFRAQWHDKEAAIKDAENTALEPIARVIGDARRANKSISYSAVKKELDALSRQSPAAYDLATKMLDAHNDEIRQERWAAEAHARAAANADGEGLGRKAKQKAIYLDLRRQVVANPKAFVGHHFEKYLGQIGNEDVEELAKLTETLNKPGEDSYREATTIRLIDKALDRAEVADKSMRALAEQRIRADLRDAKARGVNVDEEYTQKTIDRWLVDGAIERSWWPDKGGRRFEFTDEELAKFKPDNPVRAESLSDVPKADQEAIRDAGRQRGRTVTPQEIIRKYNQLNGFDK